MKRLSLLLCAIALMQVSLRAQVLFNPSPSRVLGQVDLNINTSLPEPNLVVGRELNLPQGVAVDASSSPSHLYVADTQNNRVLGWKDVTQFNNGGKADIVVGQRNLASTFLLGPGTDVTNGLNAPTAVAVDGKGNLYVVDSGNNRILRFPRPFDQKDSLKLADMVLGQVNFTKNQSNQGNSKPTEKALSFNPNNDRTCSGCYRGVLVFDASGNLLVADAANNRVVRYPKAVLDAGASGPAADLVLGQPDFVSNANNVTSDNYYRAMTAPSGIGFDSTGRMFVSDGQNRVLAFLPPFNSGQAAARVAGGVPVPQGTATAQSLSGPNDVVVIGDQLYVVDTLNNRILVFAAYTDWPADGKTAPSASAAVGQVNLTQNSPNAGQAQPSASGFNGPTGATYVNGTLYVADSLNHRVLTFSGPPFTSASKVLGQAGFVWGAPNLVEGREFHFNQGTGVAVDSVSSEPHLYVADATNNRVLGFRDVRKVQNGATADLVIGQVDLFSSTINYPSGDPNQPAETRLYSPAGVAVDSNGNLWVADRGNARVLRFPKPFDHTGVQTADLVLGQLSFTSKNTDATSRTMRLPIGLAFTFEGHLLVSDAALNRVLLFRQPFSSSMDASKVVGQPDLTSSAPGTAPNRMNTPLHIATDSDDRLYVVDSGNSRIQIYNRVTGGDQDVNPSITLTDATRTGERLNDPTGIFVSRNTGEIWVAEAGANRGLRYPKFAALLLNPLADTTIPSAAPIAVVLDQTGNLIFAEAYNRVTFYYPALAPVSGATFQPNKPLSPGMIVSLFSFAPTQFSTQALGANALPLPTDMADTKVLVNGTLAHLYYVSPGQINYLMPMSAPSSGNVEIQVVKKSTGQIMATRIYPMAQATPGFFTGPSTIVNNVDVRRIAAINVHQNGTTYGANSPSNPVVRGDFVSLYATGQGFVPNAPPDGSAPSGAITTSQVPQVLVGTDFVPPSYVQYSGLAPGFAGLWQINVKIPDTVAPADAQPVVISYAGQLSPSPGQDHILTYISVKQ